MRDARQKLFGPGVDRMVGEYLRTTQAQLIIGLTCLAFLLVIGVYVVLKFRDEDDGIESKGDLLTKFREMQHEGQISEDEYRTIKTDLKGQLSQPASAESDEFDGFDVQR